MSLETWSWLFLVVYTAGMVTFGVIGQRRVRSADDFATARGSYGPLMLGLAFAATTASGATFIGFPGLTYDLGTAAVWSAVRSCLPGRQPRPALLTGVLTVPPRRGARGRNAWI